MAVGSGDLALFLGCVSSGLHAHGSTLSLHGDEGEMIKLVGANGRDDFSPDQILPLLMPEISRGDGMWSLDQRWLTYEHDGAGLDVMLAPIRIATDRSRILLSVFFDHLTPSRRSRVDLLYRQTRSTAAEMVRLWLLCRKQKRELAAIRAALNLTEMGIMLVDRSGKLVFANRSASAMLDKGNGLRRIKNMLRAAKLQDSVRLQMALEHVISANESRVDAAASDRHAPLFSVERTGAPPLTVTVLPVETRLVETSDAAAVIYVIDPTGNMEGLIQPVCKVYRLSPVETRLTCLLTSGDSLAEAAQKMRVKEMTARSYLKQIFLKTNTHRQTGLMHLMLSSVIRTSSGIIPQPF